MQTPKTARLIHFDRLKDRLLRAGVAPRHVRRTLAELCDHYEDAVRDEGTKGLDAVAAEQAAWVRLGDEDLIAQTIIARPELRSLPARFPRLVFGLGPLVIWVVAMAATLLKLILFVKALKAVGVLHPPGHDPAWLHISGAALAFFDARILPLISGLAVVILAIRQRLAMRAPIIGAVVIAMMAGFTTIGITWPTGTQPGELFVNNWLLSAFAPFTDAFMPASAAQVAHGVAVTLINAAVILTPYLVWLKRAQRKAAI